MTREVCKCNCGCGSQCLLLMTDEEWLEKKLAADVEPMFPSRLHRSHSNIDYVLSHKTNLTNFELESFGVFSSCSAAKVEVSERKSSSCVPQGCSWMLLSPFTLVCLSECHAVPLQ